MQIVVVLASLIVESKMECCSLHTALLTVIITLLAGNIDVAAQLCDSGFITGQIVLLGDGTVSADEVQGNDPELLFFREVMGLMLVWNK